MAPDSTLARPRLLCRVVGVFRTTAVILWTAVWIPLALMAQVLTLNRDLPLLIARRCWAPGILRLAGVRLIVQGASAVDWSRTHVFVMNHQSVMDIPVAITIVETNLRFVGKASLRYLPLIGWFMGWTGMLFIDRGRKKHALDTMARAAERIRAGASILVFPEGTRARDRQLLPLKRGAFVLAFQAGVPVVPIAVDGCFDVLPPGHFSLQPQIVRVHIGSPIETAGRSVDDRAEFAREVERQLAARLEALRAS